MPSFVTESKRDHLHLPIYGSLVPTDCSLTEGPESVAKHWHLAHSPEWRVTRTRLEQCKGWSVSLGAAAGPTAATSTAVCPLPFAPNVGHRVCLLITGTDLCLRVLLT